jgi:uracil-DNA glycosylase family 4
VPAATADPVSDPRLRGLESLMAFWADSGVEAMYGDEPLDRTRAAEAAVRPKAAIPQPIPTPKSTSTRVDAAPSAPGHDLDRARRLATSAMDLDALRAAAAEYLREALGVEARVFWRGAADAAVIVVGEAPGLDDENARAPFSGAAGRLLDRMLAAAGLDGRALALHTVFWRPPGDRAPTPEEQSLCAPFVERAIALAAPRALLIAGAGAAKAVLGRSEPILSLHGRWLEWRSADGALELPALPTLSPDFLLRQPLAKRKSWSDLLTLSERVDRPHRPE